MTKKVLNVSREKVDDVWECKKLQIIAHGLGSAEALVALSSFPATGERLISHLISLAPCPIPTYHDEDDRRILSGEKDTTAEPPRELSDEATDLVEEKRGRLLKKSKAPKHAKKSKSPKKAKKSKSKEENKSTESGSLGHHNSYDNEEFWDRTERYCTAYPNNC